MMENYITSYVRKKRDSDKSLGILLSKLEKDYYAKNI